MRNLPGRKPCRARGVLRSFPAGMRSPFMGIFCSSPNFGKALRAQPARTHATRPPVGGGLVYNPGAFCGGNHETIDDAGSSVSVCALLRGFGPGRANEDVLHGVLRDGKIEVDMRDPEQMKSARGSNTFPLRQFEYRGDAENFAKSVKPNEATVCKK